MKSLPPFLIAFAFIVRLSWAGSHELPSLRAPELLALRDQFNRPQRLAFPSTNVVVLTIADREGSEEIDDWVAALKERYAGRIKLHGLADVRAVPSWLRGAVRKKFQAAHEHPVMMDWSGEACQRLPYQPGVANLFVIAPNGEFLARFMGPAKRSELDRMFAVLETQLPPKVEAPAGVSSIQSLPSPSNE